MFFQYAPFNPFSFAFLDLKRGWVYLVFRNFASQFLKYNSQNFQNDAIILTAPMRWMRIRFCVFKPRRAPVPLTHNDALRKLGVKGTKGLPLAQWYKCGGYMGDNIAEYTTTPCRSCFAFSLVQVL